MPFSVRIMPRAARQIEAAALWWDEHRPSAPDAIVLDLRGALGLLAREPGVGSRVSTPGSHVVRRLYLPRIRYFLYYRIKGNTLEVISFWHERRRGTPRV